MPGIERIASKATDEDAGRYERSVAGKQMTLLSTPPPTSAVGVDIVDIQRLQSLYERWHESLLSRLFTAQEQHTCRKPTGYRWYSLAGRFSTKEAVKKILASRGEIAGWTEIEVINGPYGEPYIQLHGRAQAAFQRLGFSHLVLSISHDANLAIATVIAS